MTHRALITGVSGFVGGFLAEHLLEVGDAVLGCSTNGQWNGKPLDTLDGNVELVAWDLTQNLSDDSRRTIEQFRPDRIYHLAAMSVPDDCGRFEPTPQAVAVNIDGTRRVLELADSLATRPRVVFVSSSHVYAPVTRDSPVVDEKAPVAPRHAYGQTKLAAEQEVLRAVEQSGVDGVIARAFQHTGPRQTARMMLPSWARQFATNNDRPIEVHTRDAMIDLCDVRDVVRAYRLLAERGRSGAVYNVGSGIARRSGQVLEILQKAADPDRPIVELRPGFKQDPIADIARLRRETGWCATIPLTQTVVETLAWWQQETRRLDSQLNEERSP